MYRAYNLSKVSFNSDISRDETVYEENAEDFRTLLKRASDSGRLDGNAIREQWFPQQGQKKVFISHSHKDLDKALQLANWLKSNLGVDAFIDSSVWL